MPIIKNVPFDSITINLDSRDKINETGNYYQFSFNQ